jgi:galactose mutarotase-like enzyme
MIVLDNGILRVEIDEELGAEVHSIESKGKNYLASYKWKSPVPAKQSRTYGSEVQDWLSEYRGGWQVLFPNAGSDAVVEGIPLPFHGEFSRTKVEILKHTSTELVVVAGARMPLVLKRSYSLPPGKAALLIQQEVTNESDTEWPFIWGEHPAFSLPPGSRIHLPTGPVSADLNEVGELQDVTAGSTGTWPFITSKSGEKVDLSIVPTGGVERLCYLHDRPEGWVAMTHGDDLIGLSWDVEAFPHIWMWQEIHGPSFPWFGRSEITALEPASTWPSHGLAEAIKLGQSFSVKPGETKSAWTTFTVSTLTPDAIENISNIDKEGNFQKSN